MAFCAYCGKQISDVALSCPACGHPGPGGLARAPLAPAPGAPVEGFAIASLACSISAFVLAPFIGSILGIVFGGIARRNLAKDPGREGASMARAGIIVGWVGLAVAVLVAIFVIIVLSVAGTNEVIFGPHPVRGI